METDEFTRSFNQFIKESLREIKRIKGADGTNSFVTAFEFRYDDYMRLFLLFESATASDAILGCAT